MPLGKQTITALSFRRIVGFACNQGFLFFLFYMGTNVSLTMPGFTFERVDLAVLLLFMVIGFGVLAGVPEPRRDFLLSRPLLISYGILMAAASLHTFVPAESPALTLGACALMGVSGSYLLTAWGRAFVTVPTKVAIPEVFLGTLAAAFACLLFSAARAEEAMLLMRVFPVASAAWIDPFAPEEKHAAMMRGEEEDRAQALSLKILCGTLCFGVAEGFMETFATQPGGVANPTFQVGLVLLGAFLIGALTLLLSDGFGKGDTLNQPYRLAVYVMMLGILVIPTGISAFLPGEGMVLAGYLGLEAVLVSLFLVMAKIAQSDGVAAFTRGFLALFAGEALGVACSNFATALAGDGNTPYAVVALAGALVLLSYVFLFTERDFIDLSVIVTDTDSFDAVCDAITERFGLSKRESEILPYALRGRTAARIAEELVISKSTVDTHLRRIYGKAGVHGRQELLDLSEGLRREF